MEYIIERVKAGDEGKRFNMVENDILKAKGLVGKPINKHVGDKKFFISAEVKSVGETDYRGKFSIKWVNFRNKDGSERKSRIPSADEIKEKFTIYSYEAVDSVSSKKYENQSGKVYTEAQIEKTKALFHMLKTGEHIRGYTIPNLLKSKDINLDYEVDSKCAPYLHGVIPHEDAERDIRVIHGVIQSGNICIKRKSFNLLDYIIAGEHVDDNKRLEYLEYLVNERGINPSKGLHTALLFKKIEIFEKLLEFGADPNEEVVYERGKKNYHGKNDSLNDLKSYTVSAFELAVYYAIYMSRVMFELKIENPDSRNMPWAIKNAKETFYLMTSIMKRRMFSVKDDKIVKFIKDDENYKGLNEGAEVAETHVKVSSKILKHLQKLIDAEKHKDMKVVLEDIHRRADEEKQSSNAEPGGTNYLEAMNRFEKGYNSRRNTRNRANSANTTRRNNKN